MRTSGLLLLTAALALGACAGAPQQSSPAPAAATQAPAPRTNLPLKHVGGPTVSAITPTDLMTRLYPFSDDSMGGRLVGTEGADRGARFLARSLERIGVRPAGENGTYFQDVPVYIRNLDPGSTITVDGRTLRAGVDFTATRNDMPRDVSSLPVVFFGTALDTIDMPTPASLTGKLVLLRPFTSQLTQQQQQALIRSDGYARYVQAINAASAIATIAGDTLSTNIVRNSLQSQQKRLRATFAEPTPVTFVVTTAAAEALLGAPLASAARGQTGRTAAASLRFDERMLPARNVVAVIPGSDPQLRGQYVVFSTHSDAVGTIPRRMDHDSVRAFATVLSPGGQEGQPRTPTPADWLRVNALKDSLRAAHGGVRLDSIRNGADDDGSGSVALLEIAEALHNSAVKPKRSLLFVWQTGEESGMWGSSYFVDNPTVPRDSMVAALNMDMIGRGGPGDVPNGGPSYLQLLGSRRLSTEYGDLVETVNRETNAGFTFDYAYDANGHPQQYYCRSDHWSYARWGIPVTFFSTGGHRDYHMITDEPQYIDYYKLASVATFIHDVGIRVANLDHRVAIDKPKGNGRGQCVQ